jgi:hypothetical protein
VKVTNPADTESVGTPATGPTTDVTDSEPEDAGLTVMVNVWAAEASIPPSAVPPSSFRTTVTVAVPFAFGAGVNVSVPSAATAGDQQE